MTSKQRQLRHCKAVAARAAVGGALALSLAVLCIGSGSAANQLYLREWPIRYMNKEDVEILQAAINETLDKQSDGATSRWENPKTGARGELTPRASFREGEHACRDLEVANSAGGRSNRLVLKFCRQPDGQWKVEPE